MEMTVLGYSVKTVVDEKLGTWHNPNNFARIAVKVALVVQALTGLPLVKTALPRVKTA